ncbi:type II toxin-antitoxin system VapC family toxin [Luteimonas huabeiensis]|uniref:type II toxin-antitoxin system VapC family toxin n=1 Tax=Luteimonas huabeiensis TaxID=1244513 RepID=UPI000463F172|nr:type II toxin-antitoxin system VapC family toxin [Luteimonas huabeiensis]
MIALDASVLLDILAGDPVHAEASETCIGDALAREDVVVCDAVVAEVQAMLDTSASLMDVLSGLGIRYEPTHEAAAMRAGHMYRRFRTRGGQRERVIADFLIGAHALLQCDGLITRDAAFFRDYFKGLKLIVPSA